MGDNKTFDIFEGLVLKEEDKKIVKRVNGISDIIFHIIKKRMDLNLTQRDLAVKTGIKQPMIARIETLKTIPRLDTLMIIASELGLELKTVDKEDDMKTINIDLNINITISNEIQSYIIDDRYTQLNLGGYYAI